MDVSNHIRRNQNNIFACTGFDTSHIIVEVQTYLNHLWSDIRLFAPSSSRLKLTLQLLLKLLLNLLLQGLLLGSGCLRRCSTSRGSGGVGGGFARGRCSCGSCGWCLRGRRGFCHWIRNRLIGAHDVEERAVGMIGVIDVVKLHLHVAEI